MNRTWRFLMHPRRRRFLAIAAVVAIPIGGFLSWRLYRPPALYRMTILPSLGGRSTLALSMNDVGQVAGVESIGTNRHYFLWDHGNGMQDLGPAIGDWLIINNAGQIAGTMSSDPNGKAFLWESGKGMTMLDTPESKGTSVTAMNNRGQVVGVSKTADGVRRAFLWERKTGMTELEFPAGIQYTPVSITDAGQILVGAVKRTVSRPYSISWFFVDSNGPKPVAPVPPDMWIVGANDNSCILAVERPGDRMSWLFLRDEQGTWRGLFRMHSFFFVHDLVTPQLNNRNQIAYTERIGGRGMSLRDRLPRWLVHPRASAVQTTSYLWDPARGRIPLNRYLGGLEGFRVKDLNNSGCIVGTGKTRDGIVQSVLLEPIPERWGK